MHENFQTRQKPQFENLRIANDPSSIVWWKINKFEIVLDTVSSLDFKKV